MLKKLIALGGAGAAVLAMVIPTLACTGPSCFIRPDDGTRITTTTESYANTGGNSQSNMTSVSMAHDVMALTGSGFGTRTINTGNAYADARSTTIVNTNPCGCMNCCNRSGRQQDEDSLRINSEVYAGADSGKNYQDNMTSVEKASHVMAGAVSLGGSSTIRTGDVSSISRNRVLVNVRTVGFVR